MRYSKVFGMVFRVFGFCAHLQILQIPHLALFQIPTNYPFYNINRGESGNRWGGQVFLCTQPCHFLELYHAPFVLADVPALGVVQIGRDQISGRNLLLPVTGGGKWFLKFALWSSHLLSYTSTRPRPPLGLSPNLPPPPPAGG